FICPIKQVIWWPVLFTYFPDSDFNTTDIIDTITNLKTPKAIRRSQLARLYTVISTIHWTVWIHYWKFIFDKQPFLPVNIFSAIKQRLAILLNETTYI
ncbi:hypothetical protein BDF21DRAFT_333066, partial [Thamnidium elegans]